MAQPDSISTLRRRRNGLANRFTITKRQLDEYEESGQVNKGYLVSCRNSFDEYWRKLSAVQGELEVLDQGEIACRASLLQEHLEINTRLIDLFDQIPATTPSTTKTRDSCVNPEPTPITLPEVSLPQFDGAFENWTYSYDTFSSTVDRNEHLTEVQKVQHESTHQVEAVQLEIELLDSDGQSRDLEIREQYEDIYERLRRNQRVARQAPSSRPRTSESVAAIKSPRNVFIQPTSHDPLDRKEVNPVQDNKNQTPPTGNTTLHITPDMDVIAENLSPGPNVKNSPSPWRRGATPASDPDRDNLHAITTMTNHLIVGSFQNAPADFNTCPLSPQITTSDKSLILSFADCWTTPVQLPAISEKAQSEGVNGGSLIPQSTMTSFTFPQPKQERGCPNDMQYFHGSDVAEIPYKKGETCSRSYHEPSYDTWDKTTPLGQIIGGSSVPQSNTKLCDVFEPVPCIIGVSFNDTSWAEVFHNTSWAKLFHDASWIVNFIAPSARRRTRLQDRRIPSAHRPFGRIIKFLLAITTSSGRPQSTRQQQSTRRRIGDLINSTSIEF